MAYSDQKLRAAKATAIHGGKVNQQPMYDGNGFHLAQSPELYEVQRSNNFEFIVAVDGKLSGADQEVIRLSVVTASVPHFTQGVIEVKRGNDTIKYAGVPTFDAGSFTCNDYIGANTKEVLMAWQAKSYDINTRKVGLAEDYKMDCELVEYSPDYQEVRRWKLHGCWITGMNEDNYDAESNNKKKITVNFVYDWAQVNEG